MTVWCLEAFEVFAELFHGDLCLAEDLSYQGAGQISTRMAWESGCSAVRVAIEDMTSLLSYEFEPQLPE